MSTFSFTLQIILILWDLINVLPTSEYEILCLELIVVNTYDKQLGNEIFLTHIFVSHVKTPMVSVVSRDRLYLTRQAMHL